jgi:transcriptional regulator with XRE-family HTH domain
MAAKGRSQADLARASRVGRDRISKYVRGIYLPQIAHLESIAAALGVDPADLIKSETKPKDSIIRLEVRGDVAVLTVEGLFLRYPEAMSLIKELRRFAVREDGPEN